MFYENDIPFIVSSACAKGFHDGLPQNFSVHWHEDIEILYYRKAGGYVYVDGEIIEPQAGDIIIVNPMESHEMMRGSKLYEYDYYIISPKMFAASGGDIFDRQIQTWMSRKRIFLHCIRNDRELVRILEIIREEKEAEKPGYEMIIRGNWHLFFGILLRKYEVAQSDKRVNAIRHSRSERLKEIFRFVEEHYADGINSKILAAQYGVCEEHFCRLFRKITQLSANEYITKYRVMKAEQLLLESDLEIAEISERVGFREANYFSRVFRKINGISPLQYRKTNGSRVQKFSLYEK